MDNQTILLCVCDYLYENGCDWMQSYHNLYNTCKHLYSLQYQRGSLSKNVINNIKETRRLYAFRHECVLYLDKDGDLLHYMLKTNDKNTLIIISCKLAKLIYIKDGLNISITYENFN